MIKIRLKGKDVTIKKVEVSLDENIKDILLDYVGRRKVEAIIAYLKKEIEGTQLVIAEIDDTMFEFKFGYEFVNGYEPQFEKYKLEEQISDSLSENGLAENEIAECVPLIYSLKEVPDESNEETEDTSQDEAGAEISET